MSTALTRKRTVRMTQGMYERIDRARGGVPFEKWARNVFEREVTGWELDHAHDRRPAPTPRTEP